MPLAKPASRGRVDVTVVVPTYNGDAYLERLLTAVEGQDYPGSIEILVIDSGSTDATLEIIAAHSSVRLVQIPNSEFGHGKTRNQAAQLARGARLAFLSHDAVPTSSSWLTNLLAPLDDPSCWVVYGRQIARPSCFPSLRYEIDGVFAAGDSGRAVTIVRVESGDVSTLTPAQLFHSDVNAATLRDVVVNEVPFRDVAYSEDLAFARDVLAAGRGKAYAREAVVEHSNDVTFADYGRRVFDETLGRKRAGLIEQPLTVAGMIGRLARDIIRTWGRILRDPHLSPGAKVRWIFLNPAYLVKKWVNIRRGQRTALADDKRIARFSLEKRA